MTWTEKDLQNIKAKGLKVDGIKSIDIVKKPKKIVKVSVEKRGIEFWLQMFKRNGLITDYVTEHKFHHERKFRFDWAIPDLKISIEYEGIHSKKSGHTTVSGFNSDIEKYNLALTNGWKVLRYTANNYKNLEKDLRTLLNDDKTKMTGYCRLKMNGAIDIACGVPCNSCMTASADDLLISNFNL